jgi:hypothetical protein
MMRFLQTKMQHKFLQSNHFMMCLNILLDFWIKSAILDVNSV